MSGGIVDRSDVAKTPVRARHFVGCYIVLCLLLGGGVDKGLASDYGLQLLSLPLICFFFMRFPDRGGSSTVNVLVALIMVSVLVQLVPTFGLADRFFAISVDGGRTLDSFAMLMVWLSLFYWLLRLEPADQAVMLCYVQTGVALNLAHWSAQYAIENYAAATQFLPFGVRAGFFANPNHLSALFYVSVPLIVALSKQHRLLYLSPFFIAVLAAAQVGVGSRAGVMLLCAGALAGYAIVSSSRVFRGAVLVAGVATAGVALWLYGSELLGWGDRTFERHLFAKHTWAGFIDQLPFGVGYGNFVLVYPRYETLTGIFWAGVEHAHNDYLELLLEGGILAAALMIGYMVLFIRRLLHADLSLLQKCAACSISLLLVHSLIDYPLRTMALGVVFVVLNAVFFGPPGLKNQDSSN